MREGCRAGKEERIPEEGQTETGEQVAPKPDVTDRKGRKRVANLAPRSKKDPDVQKLVNRAKNRKTEQERRDRIHEG